MRLFVLATVAVFAGDSALLVDRGLPKENRNVESGDAARSNIRWTLFSQGFVADDFSIGQPGEKYLVETVRVWTVPGARDTDPAFLGDLYEDLRLYFGREGSLSPVASGRLEPGSNQVDGASVSIRETGEVYENFGAQLKIYEVEFRNLHIEIEGGATYRFGAWGLGRPTGEKNEIHPWFTHGSNAAQSGVAADGADGKLFLYEGAGRFGREYRAAGAAWNKDADLNVQVLGRRVN